MLHTYIAQPMSIPIINFPHLVVSKIYKDKILMVKVTPARSSQGCTTTWHTYTPNNITYQLSTPYGFHDTAQTRFLKFHVTTESKVKSRPHHEAAYLHSLSNVPTKYPLPTPCGFCDTAQQDYCSCRPAHHLDAMGENNKGSGVKSNASSIIYYSESLV